MGGDDEEGLGHRVGEAVHGDLALLHGLQQGGLGAGGGPVEFIGQEEVAQHRAGLVVHLPGLFVVERVAYHIGRHHIGGELHSPPAQTQGTGKGQGQGGLAHAGHILQQHMASGQNDL